MATQVYTTEVIELQDGTEVTLRPLPIKQLREFMRKLTEFGEKSADMSEDEGVDLLLDLAVLCLRKNKATSHLDKEELEDILDLPTTYKVIEVCGGVKLNDPKMMEMAQELTMGTAGTN